MRVFQDLPDAPHIEAVFLVVAVLIPISKILDPCEIWIVLSGGPVGSGTIESTDGGSVCVDCVYTNLQSIKY